MAPTMEGKGRADGATRTHEAPAFWTSSQVKRPELLTVRLKAWRFAFCKWSCQEAGSLCKGLQQLGPPCLQNWTWQICKAMCNVLAFPRRLGSNPLGRIRLHCRAGIMIAVTPLDARLGTHVWRAKIHSSPKKSLLPTPFIASRLQQANSFTGPDEMHPFARGASKVGNDLVHAVTGTCLAGNNKDGPLRL